MLILLPLTICDPKLRERHLVYTGWDCTHESVSFWTVNGSSFVLLSHLWFQSFSRPLEKLESQWSSPSFSESHLTYSTAGSRVLLRLTWLLSQRGQWGDFRAPQSLSHKLYTMVLPLPPPRRSTITSRRSFKCPLILKRLKTPLVPHFVVIYSPGATASTLCRL